MEEITIIGEITDYISRQAKIGYLKLKAGLNKASLFLESASTASARSHDRWVLNKKSRIRTADKNLGDICSELAKCYTPFDIQKAERYRRDAGKHYDRAFSQGIYF